MKCEKCGAWYSDASSRCPNCGEEVNVILNANGESVNNKYVGPLGTSKPVFVWGLIGLIMSCFFYTSPLGIAFSCVGLSKAKRYADFTGGLIGRAKAGKIMSVVGLILGIIFTVLLTILIVSAFYAYNRFNYRY